MKLVIKIVEWTFLFIEKAANKFALILFINCCISTKIFKHKTQSVKKVKWNLNNGKIFPKQQKEKNYDIKSIMYKISKYEYVKSMSNISVENILRNGIKKGSTKHKSINCSYKNMLLQRKHQKNKRKNTSNIKLISFFQSTICHHLLSFSYSNLLMFFFF